MQMSSSLSSDLAHHILHYNTKFNVANHDQSKVTPLFQSIIAIAGGGAGAISALTSTPNASSFLQEGIVTYDRMSFVNFVTSPSLLNQSSQDSANNAIENVPLNFKFSSPHAAKYLARAALKKSLQYTFAKDSVTNNNITYPDMQSCIGVGCASMLSAAPGTRKSKRNPHGHVCIMYPDGSTYELSCMMHPTSSSTDNDDPKSEEICALANRREQDEKLSCIVLLSILISIRGKLSHHLKSGKIDKDEGENAINDLNKIIQNSISQLSSHKKHEKSEGTDSLKTTWTASVLTAEVPKFSMRNIISKKAKEIIDGKKQAVLLLPQKNKYAAFEETILPIDSLIFPGSFNPIHVGHISLAHAAMKVIMEKRQAEYDQQQISLQDSGIEKTNSLWDVISDDSKITPPSPPAVFFEVSITNADKAPMDIPQVEKRSEWILEEMNKLDEKLSIPTWGVLLDSAPLFIQKVDLMEQIIASLPGSSWSKRKMTFVIGTDTLIRILDIKYYDQSKENMLSAIRDMKRRGVHFVVGGRSEQGKKGTEPPQFIDGSKEVASQPQDVQEMFTLLKEEDFRVDMSSTEIRKARTLE